MQEKIRKTQKMNMENFLWHGLPVLAFILWGILCLGDSLWYDEAFSAGLVMQPWRKLIYITAIDDHSPFYYVLLKLFYHLTGGGTHFFKLKLFSLIFMMGYMLLGKFYVKKLFGKSVSVWFMIFSLLSPIMSVQAGNVRMYALALFFLTLTGLLAYDLYLEENRRKWLLFTGATICVVYCHSFAVIQAVWFYLLFGAVLVAKKRFQTVRRFLMAGIVVSVAFLPWLLVTLRQIKLRMLYDTGSTESLAGLKEIVDYVREWFSSIEAPRDMVAIVGLLLCLFLIVEAYFWMKEKKCYAPCIGGLAFLLTVLTGFIISATVNNCFLGRYAFPGFGFLMLLCAVGMEQIRGSRGFVLAVAVICFALQYQSEVRLEYDGGLKEYERFREQYFTEGDILIAPEEHAIFLSVYHPEETYYLYGYVAPDLSFPNLKECYDLGALTRASNRVFYICFEGDAPEDVESGLHYEQVYSFRMNYYDFVIYKMID